MSFPIGATAVLAAFIAGQALPAPRITRVNNAAGFGRFGTPNWPVAPGSLVTISGQGIGPEEPVKAQGYPLPLELGGVTVQVTGGNQTLDAWIVSAGATQVTFLLPSRARTGEYVVRLRYLGETAVSQMAAAQRNFGIFTANEAGTGPAAVPVTFTAPARPAQMVTLRGTGLGAIDTEDGAAPRPGDLRSGIHVIVGTTEAKVSYAGRSECCAGVDEVVFEVPGGVEGCYVPVVTVLDDVLDGRTYGQRQAVSNTATIAISADGGVCKDPTGLTGEDLQKLQQMDKVKAAGLLLGHTYSTADLGRSPEGADRAAARFVSAGVLEVLTSTGIYGLPAPGSCIANAYDDAAEALTVPQAGTVLDAGAQLEIRGPAGALLVPRGADGGYFARAARGFFTPGAYEVSNGEGGEAVGGFRVSVSVPAPVVWTNKDRANPPTRFARVRIEWQGGQPGGLVVFFAMAENNAAKIYSVCTERAEKGTLVEPAHGPYSLPIDSRDFGGSLPALIGFGSLETVRFGAPGIDFGLIGFSFFEAFYSP